MKLSKLLEHLNFTCIQGSTDTDITDLLHNDIHAAWLYRPIDDLPAADRLRRIKVLFPEACDKWLQPLPLVKQIHLRPQVFDGIR